MKKIIITLFGLSFFVLSANANMKIGTVDMMTLVRNHKTYESNKKFLTDSEKESTARLDSMRKDVEKIQAEGQKLAEEAQNPMLAAGKRQEIEKQLVEIQKKFIAGQQQLRNEAMRAQQDLQATETKFLKITGDDLRKTINEFAEKNGYDLVIDSSAVPYAKPAYDVTDGVLKAMGVDPEKAVKPGKDEAKNEGK